MNTKVEKTSGMTGEVTSETVNDAIEKTVVLKAPLGRVFRAIADSREFGEWFGFRFDGPFEVGRPMRGRFVEDFDEASMMEHHRKQGVEPHPIRTITDAEVFCTIEAIEPETYFAFRWIPYGIDQGIDPASEPKTLVEFRLRAVAEGTALDIRESGFSAVPAWRRQRAFRMNEGGWPAKARDLKAHVEAN